MAVLPTAPVAAGSLVAGFTWCASRWWRSGGAPLAGGLLGVYAAALVGSHVLAKRIGAWPSVLTVASVSWAPADRRR